MTTKPRTCKFHTNAIVEIEAPDFTQPGMPMVWHRGTVTEVADRDGNLWDVMVRTDAGHLSPQIVGARGGNRRIRVAA